MTVVKFLLRRNTRAIYCQTLVLALWHGFVPHSCARRTATERRPMLQLGPIHAPALIGGVVLGVAGFAPLAAMVLLVRSKRIKGSIGKGLAAIALSFTFLMAALALVWVAAPQDILVVTIGVLGGFLVMWVVLAAITMSRGL